ncbi:UNVERIFIED_ORG: hypothetical protein DFO82_0351 [Idiomarina abyssalis]|uniref:hypothetical protein n=1 Tax=Idiomarina sp. 017G TaxID=2183988 RepID=UPI000E0E1C54|nr:hypothetical protein [Idiomarina sp. 017G]TDO53649.1 hypothetical protein DEU30_101689 [Idiomarina sp. 017G]
MSNLDKDKVIAEYTEAYQKAHGKKPKIESSNGWYSVDGGKNVRLSQLADDAKALGKEKKSAPKKSEPKKTEPKKAEAKKPAAKKSSAKQSSAKKSSSGGLTAKELWKQKLEGKDSDCRLPRGSA